MPGSARDMNFTSSKTVCSLQTVGQERDTAVKVQQSTRNVFRDLGFGSQEAESLRLRAELMVEVRRLIQARKLTQRSAANLLGVTQPRISDLIRGKIDLFSIDTLVNMLARAGMRVQLRIAGGRGRRAQAA
jgi:predicted XRE-type DNA-binding protein